ncbi:guanine deaminase [Vibrio sp. ES.051]|uniref:amidohydrolase family protein n=1 Tax=Vibrio sp. ES.051 TaxID=1761909 RepID=UPI000C010064|nr:amidohydrolase family protein [Vibrio sp. ES.051]PFG56272.1 guanine deaminase [Vibrio sp. ES.051]
MKRAILGSVYHTPTLGSFEQLENALIVFDSETGLIESVTNPAHTDYAAQIRHFKNLGGLETLKTGQYILPGMIDLHIHAPQWPQAGKGLDLPLDQWLQTYTFPLESRYQDIEFSKSIYPGLVSTYLSHGTTTAVYFATVDVESSTYLAQECLSQGQRAFVGKVAMDESSMCPDYYMDDGYQASIELTETFIQNVRNLDGNHGLVEPIVTPRFVPTCTKEAMRGLGELAKKYHCAVQTHASESDWARDFSEEKYGKTDVELYEEAGLLGPKTLLAHSIFLTKNDLDIVQRHHSSLAHCPLSNTFFANAALPCRELLDTDIQVGLGSDIAASPYPSLFRSCFDAVTHSRARENGVDYTLSSDQRGTPKARITLLEAYWMATVGGAKSLKLNAGTIQAGQLFDAICIDTTHEELNIFPSLDSTQDIFEKIIAYTDRNHIIKVWVNGRAVKQLS